MFANKTKAGSIPEKELDELSGDSCINIFSEEEIEGYQEGKVSKDFLKTTLDNLNQAFYIGDRPPMIEAI